MATDQYNGHNHKPDSLPLHWLPISSSWLKTFHHCGYWTFHKEPLSCHRSKLFYKTNCSLDKWEVQYEMFNNQVMTVHEKSASLSRISQNFKWTFHETLNLGYKFLASKHYPHNRAFSKHLSSST